MSKCSVPTLTGPKKRVAVHLVTWLLECCASGVGVGGGGRRSRKRTNLSATRTMTVTITTPIKRHSNVLWRSRSIPACTATPDWNQPPSCLVKLQEQTHEYHLIKKTPKKTVEDSPLAVNLWWFWSFFPSPLWETWSKDKITRRESDWYVIMTPIRWWAEAHLMLWVKVNNLKAAPELLLSTSKGHWRQCFLCFSDTNLAGMLPRAF